MKRKSIKHKSIGTELIKSIEEALKKPKSVKTVRFGISNKLIDDEEEWLASAIESFKKKHE